MLPRERSIFRIWKGCGEPNSGPMSRTGRISTWLPGRNATAPLRSTVNPPFTRPKMTPVTRSLPWKFFSRRVQASSRRAFSRDSEASPFLSSMRSRKTSTMSPTWISGSLPAAVNSFSATRPSDLRPTSMRAASFSIEMTRPLTTVPSRLLATPIDSSSREAKFSFGLSSAVSVATAIPCPRSRIARGAPPGSQRSGQPAGHRARPHRPGPARQGAAPRRISLGLTAVGGERALNNPGSELEGLIGIEPGRVYRDGIGGCREGSDPTPAVARVAFRHVLQDIAVYNRRAALPQLPQPPLGARLGARRDEKLNRGIGAHRRADVAAVEHGPLSGTGRMSGKIALECEQCRAHARDRRDHRRGLGHLLTQ